MAPRFRIGGEPFMPSKRDIQASNSDAISQIPRSNPLQDDFNWTVPVESVPLPSNGKIYPQNSGLFNRELVQIKAMTAQEEDILMSRALIKEGTVLTHLINSCLIDKSINSKDLIAGDRNALLVAIRITGYGADYRVEVSCPECNTKQTSAFDLSDLDIKRLTIEPITPGTNQFEYTLPVSKKRVIFKFMTGRDEEEQSTILERRRKAMPDIQIDTIITSKLEFAILSIENVQDRNKTNTFIKSMPALDSKSLRNYISDNEPGIDMTGKFRCSHCSANTQVSLPLGSSFFWP
jgi:hypothetical protein